MLTADQLHESLTKTGGVPVPLGLRLIGMVQPSTDNVTTVFKAAESQYVLFSIGTSCALWIPIPLSLIENAEPLGRMPCREHHHDVVRLTLKEPKSDEGRVLAALLQSQYQSSASIDSDTDDAEDEWFGDTDLSGRDQKTPNSRIRITNRGDMTYWVKISRSCGSGSDSWYRIGPGESETWRRCVYRNVTIRLRDHGGEISRTRHLVAVTTSCNNYAIEGDRLIYLGPPTCL